MNTVAADMLAVMECRCEMAPIVKRDGTYLLDLQGRPVETLRPTNCEKHQLAIQLRRERRS